MTASRRPYWFDGHLDLAYLAVRGRKMLLQIAELDPGAPDPHAPVAVTLPALKAGNVRMALATIFTEPVEVSAAGEALAPEQYAAGDVEGAYRRGRAQLEAYLTWSERGVVALDVPAIRRTDPEVGEMRAGMGVASVVPRTMASRATAAIRDDRLHVGILMENADPIREPGELAWWAERGVVVIGMCWAKPSRYAHGNSTDPRERIGLTELGRELVREMDRLGIMHDASHLSDRSLDDLFEATGKRVVASHSNCRALMEGQDATSVSLQRHLSDRAIREIVRRGGVIGLNLFSAFLDRAGRNGRATIEHAVAHVDRVCDLAGGKDHVALGSDMDGGFSAARLPEGIDAPRDLRKLLDALGRRGWNERELEGFAHGNWLRALEC